MIAATARTVRLLARIGWLLVRLAHDIDTRREVRDWVRAERWRP